MPVSLVFCARGSCGVTAFSQQSLSVGQAIDLAGGLRLVAASAPGTIANVFGSNDQVVGGDAIAGWNEAGVVASLTGPVFAYCRNSLVAGDRIDCWGLSLLRESNMGQGCSDERGCNYVSRDLQNQAFRGLHSDHVLFHVITLFLRKWCVT